MNLNRLLAVSEMIIAGEPVADIGSDHGLLPLYLLQQGIIPFAVATDVHKGPYEHMVRAFTAAPGGERIEARLGDGLAVLMPSEVSTIIIAGMGGDTMVNILDGDWPKAQTFKRYVFQPMSRAGVLRRKLAQTGWEILDETVVQEAHRFYPIIKSCPGTNPYGLSPLEMDIGPIILPLESEAAMNYKAFWLHKYRLLYDNLCRSRAIRPQEIEAVNHKIKNLEGIWHGGES